MAFKRTSTAVFGARRELGLHHTKIFTTVCRPGYPDARIHAVYLLTDNGPELFKPFVTYILASGQTRKLAFQANCALAVGLFIDFLTENSGGWLEGERPKAFAAFAEALVGGTVRADGTDPSGLYWPPRSVPRATYLLRLATQFGDWLCEHAGEERLNPFRKATVGEGIAMARRDFVRSERSVFGRLKKHTPSWSARRTAIDRKIPSGHRATKVFPCADVERLVQEGCARRSKPGAAFHEKVDVRHAMILLLLQYGGLRVSEPFHIYVSDVQRAPENPASALVRLYHPEQGEAPLDYTDPQGRYIAADREEYLLRHWRWRPRTLLKGRYHAGWKNNFLTDASRRCAEVHWFPPAVGELFMELFDLYIAKVRPGNCAHPFLFVSEREAQYGQPYTLAAFAQAHPKIVERLGYVSGKDFGTTPHGHRHFCGTALARAGVDRAVIQRVLHHRSPWSQDVYTELSSEGVSDALNRAEQVRTPGAQRSPFDDPFVDLEGETP